MIETKKIIVKLPRVGFMTLVGFMNTENKWPMLEGNCFSMMDCSVDNSSSVKIPPMVGKVVNMRAEDFQYLTKNSPDLIEDLEVEVLSIGSEHKYIFITDERLKDWLVDDICSICIPSSIRGYLENRKGVQE